MKTRMGNVMVGAMVCVMSVVNSASADIAWVHIHDPGVSGHEGFIGYMSKYETTNAQYCEFLNAAFTTGDITVSGNYVYGANGSNSGVDFVGQVYYDLAGAGYNDYGATNGGASRINYTGSSFTVDSGFENHPVTWVSWYGATAFCNYYGYRLPTEWEWQAVADYDGSYTYGCGTDINTNTANYRDSTHPNGPTVVGAFGTYGYGMCDMAGNVWEWTSSIYSGIALVIRGGAWYHYGYGCTVFSQGYNGGPYYADFNGGFRVACGEQPIAPVVEDFYLHGVAPDLTLDNTAPTGATAKYQDSPSLRRTEFKEIGIWGYVVPPGMSLPVNSAGDLHVWVGLKNSDDQGTYFDIRAELFKNGVPLGSCETLNVQGVTRNPDKAKDVVLNFGTITPTQLNPWDVLSLRVLAKVTAVGGHSGAVGLRLYYDSVSRPSRFKAGSGL